MSFGRSVEVFPVTAGRSQAATIDCTTLKQIIQFSLLLVAYVKNKLNEICLICNRLCGMSTYDDDTAAKILLLTL